MTTKLPAEIDSAAASITNHPYDFPINYIVDHLTILCRVAEGTKLDAAVFGTALAFEIDSYDPETREEWSVVTTGSAPEIEKRYELFPATSELVAS